MVFNLIYRMSPVTAILLILVSSVISAVETCMNRRCPLGQFYNDTIHSCVESCYPNYGNWTTGNCVQGEKFVIIKMCGEA